MELVKLTKFEVAKLQLIKAIDLFCSQEPLPAITLAGAAEEILGKLIKEGGGINAIESEIKDRCDLYQTVFCSQGDPKEFATLINCPRNEVKHLMSGNELEFNLEEEAINIIQRAIDNFQKFEPGPNKVLQRFEDMAAVWYRQYSEEFVKQNANSDTH